MEMVGLRDPNIVSRHLPHGEQKLLDIGLALALEPSLLLLDEPTAGMGPEERVKMIERIHGLWERERITVIFIEHDMDIVLENAKIIQVLSYGELLAEEPKTTNHGTQARD